MPPKKGTPDKRLSGNLNIAMSCLSTSPCPLHVLAGSLLGSTQSSAQSMVVVVHRAAVVAVVDVVSAVMLVDVG